MRTALRELGKGCLAAWHEPVLIVPGEHHGDRRTAQGRVITLPGPLLPGTGALNLRTAHAYARVVCTTGFAERAFARIGARNVVRAPLGVDLRDRHPGAHDADLRASASVASAPAALPDRAPPARRLPPDSPDSPDPSSFADSPDSSNLPDSQSSPNPSVSSASSVSSVSSAAPVLPVPSASPGPLSPAAGRPDAA
ncbi:hypothetical protein GCM10010358_53770 [Streptomyces minutiscleroticus]|uniref:Uncharacterized protein n=1 Tax=Streptomyces minutiscleroticus TaxID=68238 RepID=A0A918NT31_9ACTN|nr:hypothetical protein GCM10010358_53770 [Streptomyces minutiscleroticus]